ncbi:helix-turn-helix domain-containing protein [Phenylobacterium sp.]|uniref:helix-turn-helix domain-containing protein n=1 Tax=Phenylobacterium sp. TaxID=1871053 RepID=UPI003BAAB761
MRLGWSQQKLASVAGLAERTVRLFEDGTRSPRFGTLIALRKAFRAAPAERVI